jgi:hypothetical protein
MAFTDVKKALFRRHLRCSGKAPKFPVSEVCPERMLADMYPECMDKALI